MFRHSSHLCQIKNAGDWSFMNGGTRMMLYRSDDGWRAFTRQQLDGLGIYPNRVQYNTRAGKSDLVVHQSAKYTEFAVGENGLNHLAAALKDGRITAGDVVLVNLDGEEVARKPLSEVVALVAKLPPPRKGEFGRFWLFNADLTPYDASKAPI
jgi:hypothetical protein